MKLPRFAGIAIVFLLWAVADPEWGRWLAPAFGFGYLLGTMERVR